MQSSRGRSFDRRDRFDRGDRMSGSGPPRGRGSGFSRRPRGTGFSRRPSFGRPRGRGFQSRGRGGRRSPPRGPRPFRSRSPSGEGYGDYGGRRPSSPRRQYSPPRGRSPDSKEKYTGMSRDHYGGPDRFPANGMSRESEGARYSRNDMPPSAGRVERRDSRPGHTSPEQGWKGRSRSPQAPPQSRYRSRSPVQRSRSPPPFDSSHRSRDRPMQQSFGSSNERTRSPPLFNARGGNEYSQYGSGDRPVTSYGSSRGQGDRMSPPPGQTYGSRGRGRSPPTYGSGRGRSSPPSSRGRGGRSSPPPFGSSRGRGRDSSPPMYSPRGRGGYGSSRGRGRSSPPPYRSSGGSRRSPSPSYRGGRGRGGRGRGDYSGGRSKDFGSRPDYSPGRPSYGGPGSNSDYADSKPRSYGSSGRDRSSDRGDAPRERGQFRSYSRDGPPQSGRSEYRDFGSPPGGASSYDNYRGQRDQRPMSSSRGRY